MLPCLLEVFSSRRSTFEVKIWTMLAAFSSPRCLLACNVTVFFQALGSARKTLGDIIVPAIFAVASRSQGGYNFVVSLAICLSLASSTGQGIILAEVAALEPLLSLTPLLLRRRRDDYWLLLLVFYSCYLPSPHRNEQAS